MLRSDASYTLAVFYLHHQHTLLSFRLPFSPPAAISPSMSSPRPSNGQIGPRACRQTERREFR